LSFSPSPGIAEKSKVTTTTSVKSSQSIQEESWLTESNGKTGETNWDPWSNEKSTQQSVDTNTTEQNGWGDDLWGDNNASSTTTPMTSGTRSKPNSQNLTSLYQTSVPVSMSTTQMTTPVNNTYSMPVNMSGGMMPMWGMPATTTTIPVQSTSQPMQSNSFLGALTQVNQQQQQEEMERKRLQEEEEKKRREQVLQQTSKTVGSTQPRKEKEKEESDPFATLMSSVNLNLNDNSSSNSNTVTTNSLQRDNGINRSGYNVNMTSNVGLTYGNNSQNFQTNQPYYGVPMGMAGTVPMNTYMAGGPVPNMGMYTMPGMQYVGSVPPNVNMYGQFVPNTVSIQSQPNSWNMGSTDTTVNPFR